MADFLQFVLTVGVTSASSILFVYWSAHGIRLVFGFPKA